MIDKESFYVAAKNIADSTVIDYMTESLTLPLAMTLSVRRTLVEWLKMILIITEAGGNFTQHKVVFHKYWLFRLKLLKKQKRYQNFYSLQVGLGWIRLLLLFAFRLQISETLLNPEFFLKGDESELPNVTQSGAVPAEPTNESVVVFLRRRPIHGVDMETVDYRGSFSDRMLTYEEAFSQLLPPCRCKTL